MNLLFAKISLSVFCAVSTLKNEAQPLPQPTIISTTVQNGSELLPFIPGRFLGYSLFDSENHNLGKVLYKYDKEVVGNYQIEKYDANGKLVRSSEGKLQCTGNTTIGDWTPKLLDVLFVYKDKTITIKNNEMPYPATISTGDVLPDGHAHLIIVDKWRTNIEIDMVASERHVEAQELIYAGGTSYLCYRITYLQTVRTRSNNQDAVPVIFRQTEWISPAVGVIKTVTTSMATGKTVNTSILSQISNDLPQISNIPQTKSASEIIEIPNELPSINPSNLAPH